MVLAPRLVGLLVLLFGACVHPIAAIAATSPVISAVVNGASFQPGIVAGSWVTIQGQNLSGVSRAWNAGDFTNGPALPTALSDVQVTFNGMPTAISFVSPNQLTVQAPGNLAGAVSVQVQYAGMSNAFPITYVPSSPGLYTYQAGSRTYPAAIYNGTSTLVGDPTISGSVVRNARAGDVISLYATGIEPSPAGTTLSTPIAVKSPITVSIGLQNATVLGAMLVFPGEFQVNVVVPNLPTGDNPVTIGVGGLSSQPGVAIPIDAPTTDVGAWESWVRKLIYAGYAVDQGTVSVVDNAACQQFIAVFGSCFGNNAAAPYIVPVLPIDDTAVDPSYGGSFLTFGETGSPSNMFYRLSDRDAIVSIVLPPPKAAYLGYQGYVFSRSTSEYTGSASGKTTSPNPLRYELFSSIGNDLNSVILEKGVGSFWGGKPIVYVSASNSTVANNIKANAVANGLDSARIFIEPIGANVLTGSTLAADDLITLMRYALPQDSAASTQWLGSLRSNIRVYRVSSNAAISRYPTPVYTLKTGTSEAAYATPLDELSSLLSTWLTAHQSSGLTTTINMSVSAHVDATGKPVGLVGGDCIAAGTSCLGDNQDTDSYRSGVIGKLTGNNVAIVAGVNHTVTNNASYISVAVYNAQTLTGVASVSQTNPVAVGFSSGVMTGSAEAVLRSLGLYDSAASSALKAALPSLYVEFVARTCTAVPTYCIALGNPTSLPAAVPIFLTQRAYVRPGSTTGGNPDIMQTPRVIYQPTP